MDWIQAVIEFGIVCITERANVNLLFGRKSRRQAGTRGKMVNNDRTETQFFSHNEAPHKTEIDSSALRQKREYSTSRDWLAQTCQSISSNMLSS